MLIFHNSILYYAGKNFGMWALPNMNKHSAIIGRFFFQATTLFLQALVLVCEVQPCNTLTHLFFLRSYNVALQENWEFHSFLQI